MVDSFSGKLFQEIIGKPIPEPPPVLPSQISVRNVARFDLQDTMTEDSDAAEDYSSDGSEDRFPFGILLCFARNFTLRAASCS
jgi:hypothetical protein